ncbi:2-oxo acid dehydrogenase subunit E2 [Planomonospora parontospora]|uniref:2-oxo acid dehydrogenase subunit E2 n=1 Tax=Planomonospora parontospora TaxID=58119 RepID=UPI00166FF1E8|nr:2-oxo acid dehydrogenase subunit E2 [Planomonospora parontospora]GGL22253.1 dihydrolipoamide acetyltransferase component of pyruvate dehydrogenase complex [Planomonospora parontospora subsp. antibiotica]GII15686.1 dihydrolipoamide acetyltransferase component of pyruvate dehydrogenase complex [Planomonospora parontospora subsp. antibiotica]
MADVLVPKLNNQDTEYLVVEWLVGDGEPVRAGEAVAVLETSKAADEIEAAVSGRLVHVAAKDAWVAPGAVLARVVSGNPAGSAGSPSAPPAGTAEAPAAPGAGVPAGASAGSPAGDGPPDTAAASLITGPARAAMEELGVPEDRVLALGLPLVRRADVERLAGAEEDTAGRHELSKVQRAVARAVALSHRTVPAAYTVMRFDVGRALERAGALTREVRRPVGLPELFVQAVAGLHGRFPLLFASVDDTPGGAPGGTAGGPPGPAGPVVRLSAAPRVGVTLDLGEGLYVPVVRETGSLREIAATLMRHRLAAASGGFREQDLTGANITVTLHTDADVVLAVPIVLPGTSAALAVTSPRPETVLAADGSVTVRTVADIGLAYDHRLVNGRDAALFLAALRREIE